MFGSAFLTRAALLMSVSLLAGTANLRAASATFTGTAADNVFDTGTNWSTGTAPGDITGATTNTDTAFFTLAAGDTTAITLTAARNLEFITFGNTTSSNAGTFTLGTVGGSAFLLTSGGAITANGTANSENVNAPLVLENAASTASGTYTFESDTPGANRVFTFGGTVTGVATTGGTTILTLTGTSAPTAGNPVNGVIADGSGGGNLALVKNGTGTWLLGGANTYTGGTTVSAGTLRTTSTAASTTPFGTGTITLAGGTLAFGGSSFNFTSPLAVTAGTTSFVSTKGGTFTPSALTGTGNVTFSPNGTNITDSFTDFKNFAGTVEVQSSVFLRAVTGVVQTSLQNANLVLDTGGTFSQNLGTNGTVAVTIGSLAGGGTIGASTTGTGTFVYTVGGNNATTTFSGTIIDGGTKSGLTKAGTGMLTLSAANTFSGGTIINAGTLTIALNGALATGNVTVASSATLELATGVTAAHNASTRTTLTLASTSSIVMLDAPMGTVQDTVGALVVGTTALSPGTYGSATSGAPNVLPEFMGTGELVVVPEPSTWMTMLAGLAALGALAARRRRCA